jgi:hypothetical protein
MKNNKVKTQNIKNPMLNAAKSVWKMLSSSVKDTNNYRGDSVNLIQREIDKQSGENLDFAANILPDAQHERYSSLAKIPSFDWMNNRWYNYPISINENKLSPKESLQRKLKKQRYKVSYVQDGKKVEVFASSIRGVRRVVYGKKQYRVHNSTGSDVTGYFKKLLGE